MTSLAMGLSLTALRRPLLGGAGGTALPQLGALLANWDTSSITPQGDNTDLTANWVDSKSGFVAAYSTTGQGGRPSVAPKYRTNIFGTKPSIRFTDVGNGTSMLIGRPASVVAALNAQTMTCMVVFKTVVSGGNGGCLLDNGLDGTGNFMLADNNRVGSFADNYMKVTYAGQNAFSTLIYTQKSYTNGTGTFVLERWYVNGTCVGHASSAANGPGGTAGLCIGANSNNGAFVNGSFDLAGIKYWNTALTPAEAIQAHKSACDTYGQTYPWAAISRFKLIDGDSINMGLGGSTPDDSMPYKVAQSLGLSFGQWSNIAIGGDTAANMNTRGPTEVDTLYAQLGKVIHLYAMEWYNQRAAAPAPYNASVAYINARKSSTVKVCWGTSTDTSATTDADRAAYNAAFDADHSMCDGYVPVHTNANIGVEAAQVNFPANFADIVHLSAAGYTVYAPLVVTGLNSLP